MVMASPKLIGNLFVIGNSLSLFFVRYKVVVFTVAQEQQLSTPELAGSSTLNTNGTFFLCRNKHTACAMT
jgi:hypothetical protein